MADLKDARKRSVDNLQRLYTVVISLAVTESLRRTLLTSANNVADFAWSNANKWILCSSLIVTVVPFYHGANRYLDATYVTGERKASRYALMIDFFFFFIHALGMFVLALLITDDPLLVTTNDTYFFYGLAGLLTLDILWVIITKSISSSIKAGDELPYHLWVPINIFAVVAIVALAWWRRWEWLILVTIVRSFMDYILTYKFYYPPDPPEESVQPQ